MTAVVEANAAGLKAAVTALKRGGLVAFPTDTVYGLGCLASDQDAVRRFYFVKRRQPEQPAVVMVAEPALADHWADLGLTARHLVEQHWPGALTLVLRATPRALAELGPLCSGGTIALRVPDHPVALQLLRDLGGPLATSSANRSGDPPPVSAGEVLANLGEDVDAVVGGECPIGVASTIVDLSGDEARVLREGSITREALRA